MAEETKSIPEETKSIPEEFIKVIKDFVRDIRITFPEYKSFIDKWWKTRESFNYIEEEEDKNIAFKKAEGKSIKLLFDYCRKKFPPRFFDILYQNNDMFKEESDLDTEFLPNIHFKNLWQCEITDKTRDTIWKYLQLIMFSIVGTLENKEAFGDTAKMFEAINEDEFKNKLQETLAQMQGLFNIPSEDKASYMPDAEQLHDHITGMLDGKLGQLAREIAEDAASNLNMDFDGATDMKDVFQKLITNPTKLMGLVKTVGDKIDSKIKSGDLKESELMAEATEMMNKMKNMPGMGNIQSMLSKMGMGGLGGLGGKVNTGAMEANLNQKMKMAKTKERIRAKAEANNKARLEKELLASQPQQIPINNVIPDEELMKIFSSGEKVERSLRGDNPSQKKKKGKK